MPKHGKKYTAAVAKIEQRPYPIDEAVHLLKDVSYVKFDQAVDLDIRLGVDPRHADQQVRGTVALPHGLGKTIRVAVFAKGEKLREAEEAGADVAGAEDLVEKVSKGFVDFDAAVSTPDMMREVGKLGRVLGPRGLMPNPKVGTVTMNLREAIQELKAGKVEFRVDKAGIVHVSIGKMSFEPAKLRDNAKALIDAIVRAKPAAAKGQYIRSLYISGSQTPSIRLDTDTLGA
ncbi:MAG: 50S ribosomal protein L1 [Candidatus Sumerlaeia bacterium]|nr:50S ribosomal protein L1 [Candidatus Sumerlaeia bacterium]